MFNVTRMAYNIYVYVGMHALLSVTLHVSLSTTNIQGSAYSSEREWLNKNVVSY